VPGVLTSSEQRKLGVDGVSVAKVKLTLRLPPTPAQRYVGAHSRLCERNGASPIPHGESSVQEQHAIFPINGSGPKVGAAHGERSDRRVYDYILLAHLLDPASREAEGPLGRLQYDLRRAFVRIEDIAIDHDICILTKRQRAIVVKGDLQSGVSSRPKPVVHVHWRADDRGPRANLCRAYDLADNAYSGFSASTKGWTEDEKENREEAQEKWQCIRPAQRVTAPKETGIADLAHAWRPHGSKTNSTSISILPGRVIARKSPF
jgi:hypothetical protein